MTENAYLAFSEGAIGSYALAYVTPEIINERLAEFGKGMVDRRKNREKKREAPARQRSRRTLKHYRDALERLFKRAKRWGWSTGNPFEHVSPIGRIKDERDRFLNENERKALLKCCRASSNELLYPIVVFALSTGARKQGILDLKASGRQKKVSVGIPVAGVVHRQVGDNPPGRGHGEGKGAGQRDIAFLRQLDRQGDLDLFGDARILAGLSGVDAASARNG